jgi:putative membrane protein
MTLRQLLLTWELDPFVALVCVAAVLAYAWWTGPGSRTRARSITERSAEMRRSGGLGGNPPNKIRPFLFLAAMLVLVLALASPIGVLAHGYLFSAHMLQHILLVLAVPPLVLLALPAPHTKTPSSHHPASFLAPWLLGVGAMWFWHAPTLCDAASRSLGVWRVQTLSLVAMGAAFWWPIVGPRAEHRLAPFAAIVYLFTACAACTVLGILVTFSPVEVCSVYASPVDRLGVLPLLRDQWGLGPKADQEVGGLLMWVPGCLVYAASILAMYGRYVGEMTEEPT